jgi:hypothetical protein
MSKSNPGSSAEPTLIRDNAVVGVLIDSELGIKLALWVREGGNGDRLILKLLLGERLTLMLDEDAFLVRVLMTSVISDDGGGTCGGASRTGSDVVGADRRSTCGAWSTCSGVAGGGTAGEASTSTDITGWTAMFSPVLPDAAGTF